MEAALERAAQASTCDPGRWLQVGGSLAKWEEAVWPSTKVARSEKTNMFDLRFNLSTFGDTEKDRLSCELVGSLTFNFWENDSFHSTAGGSVPARVQEATQDDQKIWQLSVQVTYGFLTPTKPKHQ